MLILQLCTKHIVRPNNVTGEYFVVFSFSCVTFAAALSTVNHGRLPPLLSPLARCIKCGALNKPALTDPVQGLQEMEALQRHHQRTPDSKTSRMFRAAIHHARITNQL